MDRATVYGLKFYFICIMLCYVWKFSSYIVSTVIVYWISEFREE